MESIFRNITFVSSRYAMFVQVYMYMIDLCLIAQAAEAQQEEASNSSSKKNKRTSTEPATTTVQWE